MTGRIVTLLGAESTGKTTLVAALADALRAEGQDVATVDETLRRFCDREGRTPRLDEQRAIAAEQSRRIERAAQSHAWVLADTSALQTAVYSEMVFGDCSLYAEAQAWQSRASLTLLTALDIPWQADGLQRDGPQVREPVDALLRAALQRAGTPYAVVLGTGPARAAAALAALRPLQHAPDRRAAARWQWRCERCSDGDCERHWLRRLLASSDARSGTGPTA